MFKTSINIKVIIYYIINISIIILLITNLAINPTGFLIMALIFGLFLILNRYSRIFLTNKNLKIIDNYLILPIKRKEVLLQNINKIEFESLAIDSGLGYTDSFWFDLFINLLLGFFWSQSTCILFIYTKDKKNPYKMRVNVPKNSVRRLLKYLQSNYPHIEQKILNKQETK